MKNLQTVWATALGISAHKLFQTEDEAKTAADAIEPIEIAGRTEGGYVLEIKPGQLEQSPYNSDCVALDAHNHFECPEWMEMG